VTTAGIGMDWTSVAAASGAMALTGRSDGPPLGVPSGLLRRATIDAAAVRTLTAGVVDVDGPRLLTERAAIARRSRRGPWALGGSCRAIRTADGWMAVSLSRPTDIDTIPAVVASQVRDPWRALDTWALGRSTSEAVARARLLDLPAAPVASTPREREPADLARELGPAPARATRFAGDRPVVVDLSSLWAGPLCAHLLGLAGYRVVKVESVDRPDGARRGNAAFYDLLHSGHESVSLDLPSPTARADLCRLLAAADVVIEGSRPRVLARWGMEVADLLRADAVWVSITAYGRYGDAGNLVGFGDDVAAAAGAWVFDPATGVPTPALDAVADPLTGLAAARAVLEARARGGRWLLDVAMCEVTAEAVGPLPTTEVAPAVWLDGRWWAESTDGTRTVVRAPVGRPAMGSAPHAGADGPRVLAEVGGSG